MAEPRKHRFQIRVTHLLYEDLRALAKADSRSLADYVTVQLEKLVAPQRPNIVHLPRERESWEDTPEPPTMANQLAQEYYGKKSVAEVSGGTDEPMKK